MSAPVSRLPRFAKWMLLMGVSALSAALLTWARLPAALLLGAMIAGIALENGGAGIRLPQLPFSLAQGIIGCLIARSITHDIIHSFLDQWPLFIGIGMLVIIAGCVLGWVISHFKILPETTAIWGLLPGAASAMMIMADAYGADSRLVAFMQYLRVVLVVVLASLIARFWAHAPPSAIVAPAAWFAPIQLLPFVETLAIIVGGVAVGHLSRLSGGMILVPLAAGAVLHASGWVDIELPKWLLAASYLLLGWNVGLRFTRQILEYAARAFPQIVLCILAMMLFCAGLAYALVKLRGVDPLTAYLATSPGGVDSVAIIAASTKVDVGFAMALQICRVLLVLFIGPTLSRFFAGRIASASEG